MTNPFELTGAVIGLICGAIVAFGIMAAAAASFAERRGGKK